ncbi:MAG TPA: protein kinase, partial [Trichocoleus sp.]
MEATSLLSNYSPESKRLTLAGGLTEFPAEILDLADSLEILDLSNNQLRSLPDDFAKLQNLKIV